MTAPDEYTAQHLEEERALDEEQSLPGAQVQPSADDVEAHRRAEHQGLAVGMPVRPFVHSQVDGADAVIVVLRNVERRNPAPVAQALEEKLYL